VELSDWVQSSTEFCAVTRLDPMGFSATPASIASSPANGRR
jgi:hypothetical protein